MTENLPRQNIEAKKEILNQDFSLTDNPFNPEGGKNLYFAPLNPLKRDSDEKLFVWVDSIHEQLQSYLGYLNEIQNPDGSYPRHMVLLRGDKGCGKSSLLNLCIHNLSTKSLSERKPIIVALDESQDHDNVVELMRKAALKLKRELARTQRAAVFQELAQLSLISSEKEIQYAIEIAEEWFEEEQISRPVVFSFDGIRKEQDFWTLRKVFYRRNWIIFCTTENSVLLQKVKASRLEENFEYKTLEIGKINGNHAMKFVRDRLREFRTEDYRGDEYFPFVDQAILQLSKERLHALRFWTKVCHTSLQRKVIQVKNDNSVARQIDYEFLKETFNKRYRSLT